LRSIRQSNNVDESCIKDGPDAAVRAIRLIGLHQLVEIGAQALPRGVVNLLLYLVARGIDLFGRVFGNDFARHAADFGVNDRLQVLRVATFGGIDVAASAVEGAGAAGAGAIGATAQDARASGGEALGLGKIGAVFDGP